MVHLSTHGALPWYPHNSRSFCSSHEHERGGVLIYQTALECVINDDLREEWDKYLEQTAHHVDVLTAACEAIGIDPNEMTPGARSFSTRASRWWWR
jgi:hypothetical protein